MTTGFHHKLIHVASQGPDAYLVAYDIYEVTGVTGGRAGFTGYGGTLEEAILDAIRTERDTPHER
jgi:hypothetical protein